MRKLLLILMLALAPFAIQAQEEAAKEGEHAEGEAGLEKWKWANFAILAVLLGSLAAKQLGGLYRTHTEDIRKGIADAQAMKADAEKRIAAINQRVNALDEEIDKIRAESAGEMQREGARIAQETKAAIAKAEQQAAQEIDSAGKLARRDLKEYAAMLALQQAEERIRAQMNAASEGALIDNFVGDLARQGSKN